MTDSEEQSLSVDVEGLRGGAITQVNGTKRREEYDGLFDLV